MLNKKWVKRFLMVGVSALMLVGTILMSPKVNSNACFKNRLGAFNSKIIVTTPACDYTGDEVKPEYKVYYKSTELKEGTDYVASFTNNIEPGVANITVKGIGTYSGKKSAKFYIKEKVSKQVSNIDFEGEQFFGIAAISRFLIDTMANDYLINPEAITNVDAGMGEVFMLFPKTDDVKFTVETVALSDDGNLAAGNVLIKEVNGAVVIYSNPVEYVPNIQVVAECNGKKVTLPISYSGIDGRLVIDSEYVKDVTP